MKAKINIINNCLKGAVCVAGSKSISNRVLIIRALSRANFSIVNLSDSNDTEALQLALNSKDNTVDVGMAGTAMRFLTALFAISSGERILTGDSRMKQRPIKELVEALRSLGAEIYYEEKDGFAPLRIIGKQIDGGRLTMKADVSSQFISALLLIAPYMKKGLTLKLEGEILSKPYIYMTLELMKEYGVSYTWNTDIIQIAPGTYYDKPIHIESDWSSVSYLYQIVALSNVAEIKVEHVQRDSIQGDSLVSSYFEQFGVQTIWDENSIRLIKQRGDVAETYMEFDCTATPDLAQTIAATAVGLGVHVKISGLYNLPLKETNRLIALQTELRKCDCDVLIHNQSVLEIIPLRSGKTTVYEFETYKDHRMAMCLAPLALTFHEIIINDPMVVNKSYKSYWQHLKSLSFDIHLFDN